MLQLADIAPYNALGRLPGLPGWRVARRTWDIPGQRKHHQFIVSHPHHWCYEYRCTSAGLYIADYWCGYPQSPKLRSAVAATVRHLIDTKKEWMFNGHL